jgi:hypothetical protein
MGGRILRGRVDELRQATRTLEREARILEGPSGDDVTGWLDHVG